MVQLKTEYGSSVSVVKGSFCFDSDLNGSVTDSTSSNKSPANERALRKWFSLEFEEFGFS